MCTKVSGLISLVVLLSVAGAPAGILDDPALVIYYSFDDFDRVVPDESGNGHDGTVQGDVVPLTEASHRAAKFGGTLSPLGFGYVDLDGANFPEEEIPTSAITLAAWAKCDNTGGHHALFNARADDATWLVHPEVRSEGDFRWLLRAAGGSTIFDLRVGSVTWGEWLHYAGTYDKASGRAVLYINGEVAGQQDVANAPDIAGDWDKGARVGINVDNARPFTGLMDEFYLFRRALRQAELDDIMQLEPQLKAFAPDPADGATGVVTPLFIWQAGDTALFHNLYLGTDPDLGPDDLVAPRWAMAMYWHVPGLAPGTTYYWRIDEVELDGATTHEGDVWSFSTVFLAASDPSPRDGAKWVDAETDLAWTAGADTVSHDVYFDTDRAAVEAGAATTFQGNQVVATYDPGPLAEDTTYYWRIDEHAAEDVVYPGEVWSFTAIGPGTGVKAQYFRGMDLSGNPVLTRVEEAIDHEWGSGEIAGGLSDSVSGRWTADLEAPFTEPFQFITTSDDRVRLWLDGRLIIDNWRDHGSTDDLVKVDLVAGQVYSLRMEWAESSGNAIARLWWQSPSILREIIPPGPLQLPVRATGPYPANTAVSTPQALMLRWSAGDEATQHELYFGDDADALASTTVPLATQALDELTYDPGPLEWGKTYYWRVDEVNAANASSPWKGSLWSFTTADFIVVDDFEHYTDGIDDRIFQTWLDGFGYTEPQVVEGNGTNATVGYFDPPFAEQKIVHGGGQSMPMDYDNVNAPYYSEAERTWGTGQDWTLNGVDTLVLFVRGKTSNGPGALYVAVQDTAGRVGVVSHADAAVVTATEWVAWQIPLGEFAPDGVNVAAVKKMYIGVGNRNAPTPGEAGSLYIDDIGVTRLME